MVRLGLILSALLAGCVTQDGSVQLVGCIDGQEWADFREYCLAPDATWDPTVCRSVRINLQCDNGPNVVVQGVLQ